MKTTAEVYCSLQIEGTHNWPGCPFDEVAYLRDTHRHVFHINSKYLNAVKHLADGTEIPGKKLCEFGSRSCEMIAEELIVTFNLSRCEVSEDGENGTIVTANNECGVCGEVK